jgi:hypothetical protein
MLKQRWPESAEKPASRRRGPTTAIIDRSECAQEHNEPRSTVFRINDILTDSVFIALERVVALVGIPALWNVHFALSFTC